MSVPELSSDGVNIPGLGSLETLASSFLPLVGPSLVGLPVASFGNFDCIAIVVVVVDAGVVFVAVVVVVVAVVVVVVVDAIALFSDSEEESEG